MAMTIEQQRAVAIARARARSRSMQEPARDESRRGTTPFLNRGIADVFGSPVDIMTGVMRGAGALGDRHLAERDTQQPEDRTMMNSAANLIADPVAAALRGIGSLAPDTPFGGSESIADGMGAVGIRTAEQGAKPERMTEYIGRGVGEAAGALVPGMGAAKLLQGSSGPVRQKVGEQMIEPFVQSPRRALAADVSAGVGMGFGGGISDELSGGSDAARPYGEFLGAMVGGMGPGAALRTVQALPVSGALLRRGAAEIAPFTEAGATERARSRLRSLSEDPEAAREALSEPSLGGLSLSQRSGDRNLMALERAVRESDPPTERLMRDRDTAASEALSELLREPAAGRTIDDATQFIGDRLREKLTSLDARMRTAAERAQRRIESLSPERKASESAVIVREELERSLRRARAEENQLWQAVPANTMSPTTETRQHYQRLIEETPRAQRDNIPQKARTFLDADNSNQAFGAEETVKEMHGLYGAMREEARVAGAAGERNRARIASDIADAVLRDIEKAGGTPFAMERLNEARTFSRELNQKFTRGSVGRVLGRSREGGDSIPAEQTLDRTIGSSGLRAAVSADEMRQALGSNATAEGAAEDYLRSRFRDHTVRDGEFKYTRAQEFVRANSELLDRYPALKSQMQEAEQAQSLAERAAQRISGRADALRDPRQSQAARLIGAPIDQEIQTILRGSRDPGAAARELRRQAAKDPSGDALSGLKGGVVDYLIRNAEGSVNPDTGARSVSGSALQRSLRDRRTSEMVSGILSGEERRRLERVAREFALIERSGGSLPNIGEVMADKPNTIISFIARTLAARQGAKAGKGTSGASLLTANFATRRMQRLLESLTNDRAEALVREAITGNEDLYRILLSESAPRSNVAARRLEETLMAIGGNIAADAGRSGQGEEVDPRMLEFDVTPQ